MLTTRPIRATCFPVMIALMVNFGVRKNRSAAVIAEQGDWPPVFVFALLLLLALVSVRPLLGFPFHPPLFTPLKSQENE